VTPSLSHCFPQHVLILGELLRQGEVTPPEPGFNYQKPANWYCHTPTHTHTLTHSHHSFLAAIRVVQPDVLNASLLQQGEVTPPVLPDHARLQGMQELGATFEDAQVLLGLGAMCVQQQQYQEAVQYFTEGLASIPATFEGEKWDALRMNYRWGVGGSLWMLGRFLEGIQMLHLALRESVNSPGLEFSRQEGINEAYGFLGQLNQQMMLSSLPQGLSLSDAAAVFDVGASIFEETGELEKQGTMLSAQGDCSVLMGDYKRALERFQLALHFLPLHPFLDRCTLLLKITTHYDLMMDDARAGKRACRQAIRLIEEGDESTSSAPIEVMALRIRLQARLVLFLGEMEADSTSGLQSQRKEKEKEKDWHRKRGRSRQVARALKQLARLILTMPPEVIGVFEDTYWLHSSIWELKNHWGSTKSLERKPKPQKILRFANEFLSKFEHIIPPSSSIMVRCHKGEAETDLELLSEAHKTLRMALDDARATSNVAAEEVQVLKALALLEVKLNNHENALMLATQAKELAISHGHPIHQLLMLECLTYRHLGRLEEAVACDQQARALGPPIPGIPNPLQFEWSFCLLLDSLPPEERLVKLAAVPIAGDPDLLARKGDALFKLGKFRKALKCFTEAYHCKPSLTFMEEIFGCYRQLGDLKQANEWGLRFLENWEANQEHVRGDDELNQSILSTNIGGMFRSVATTLAMAGEIESGLEVCERGRGRATVDLLENKADLPHKRLMAADIRSIAIRLNTVIVVYSFSRIDTRKPNQRQTDRKQDFEEQHLFIWVIPPSLDQPISFHDIHNEHAAVLPRLTLAARREIGLLGGGYTLLDGRNFESEESFESPDDNQPHPDNSLATLFNLLIKPIDDSLPKEQDPTTVTFVPDQFMFLVPWAALLDQNTKQQTNRFLIEKHAFSIVPCVRLLELLPATIPITKSSASLIVGGPTNPFFPNLPGAKKEAEQIASMMENTSLLVGEHAAKKAILDGFAGKQLIHFAGHGVRNVRPNLPEGSLVLHDTLHGALITSSVDGKDLANSFLVATEIEGSQLMPGSIVVLSGCNTGLGRLSSDGVGGLARAFLGSGASAVVMSLWAISDATTEELMVRFYRQLMKGGQSPVHALRNSMLGMIIEHRNTPHLWAGFVVFGTSLHQPIHTLS